MRLTQHEIDIITRCTADVFGRDAVVRLFGSRTRDDLHGGDIDLHVVAERDDLATLAHESQFRTRLEGHLGERRIDLVVKGPGASAQPIDRIALTTGQVLSKPGSPGHGTAGETTGSEIVMRTAYADMLDEALRSGFTIASRLSRSLAALDPRLPFTASAISAILNRCRSTACSCSSATSSRSCRISLSAAFCSSWKSRSKGDRASTSAWQPRSLEPYRQG
jgi:predicted nucleotidyltransferase